MARRPTERARVAQTHRSVAVRCPLTRSVTVPVGSVAPKGPRVCAEDAPAVARGGRTRVLLNLIQNVRSPPHNCR